MYTKIIVDPRIRAKHSEVVEPPLIVIVQQFNDEGVTKFRSEMEKAHSTGQPVIPVLIDSYGGSVYGCLDMVSVIQKSSVPVDTIITGKAMSAGAILFGMGRKRYMSEHATLMLHDASSVLWGKNEEVKADAKELERLNSLIFGILAKNCNHKPDYFAKLLHEKGHADWYLTPKEAKRHKICTDIGVPEMTVSVSVSYKFQ
jgi:ATP-dependent protease ClpP protease subunit